MVDATGRFLMPGLIDMHVHAAEADLPLFLANGITAIRELNGSPAHLALRERIAAGDPPGPRMYVSSPLLTGQSWPVRHVIVPDPDSARSLLASMPAYDFLKIYDGLSQPTYAAILDVARDRRIPVTGHIPEAVGLAGVLAAGQDLEHVEKIVWATVGHDPDPARIPDIVTMIASARIRLTPTLWSQYALMAQGTREFEALFERDEMRFVREGTLNWWSTLRRPGTTATQQPGSMGARIHGFQRDLVFALYRAGVPLLLGTDTPNPLLVPGFSVHDEIAILIEVGIPVYDVLRAGTVVAAQALGAEGRLGVIAPGAAADLILLRANPLNAPATLRRPDVVIADGRWYGRSRLDTMLDALAAVQK
jgi:imidazolonepropionase-like amidohydrolase